MNPREVAERARTCSGRVAEATTAQKNTALNVMAERLAAHRTKILQANRDDLADAEANGLPANVVGRLRFGDAKLDGRIRCLRKIAALPDPVGKTFFMDERPNELEVEKVRVPLGVILMVYEARPHVTVNAAAFCLKSGNAAILKGGSEAQRCNTLLGDLWRDALETAGLPGEAVQVISGTHEEIAALLDLPDCIDLVIPRGGKGLIKAVAERSKIPVIKHYEGICHVFVDQGADIDKAIRIIVDSKCLMPEVCNAMETLLISEEEIDELPRIIAALRKCGVTVKGCEKTRAAADGIEPATEQDWRTEYLDMVLSIRVVADVDQAVDHINTYGSGHTDVIVTGSEDRGRTFVQRVDSAVVLINASTMFCDGESLGMGAEIGISTDKLHARGPMGLQELTSYKFVIRGSGQVMGNPDELMGH